MISIIICSKQGFISEQLHSNIENTIGVPYELIVIDNSKNQYSIFEAYNIGVKQAKHDYLCFMHEDIWYHSHDWGKSVINHLSKPEIGLIGLAGSYYLLAMPAPWFEAQPAVLNLIQSPPANNKPSIRLSIQEDQQVVCVDGFWFCSRKDVFENVSFDCDSYPGFHFYDLDISMQIHTKGYSIWVVCDITVEHFSEGSQNKQWIDSANIFYHKWKTKLPVSVNPSLKKKSLVNVRAYKDLLHIYKSNRYPISKEILKIGWDTLGLNIFTAFAMFYAKLTIDCCRRSGQRITNYISNKKWEIKTAPLKRKIIQYLKKLPKYEITAEQIEVLNYLKTHSISIFPHPFPQRYKPEDVQPFFDNERKMYYVLHEGKQLYFRKDFDALRVKNCYNALRMEQDIDSPHCYETETFRVEQGDVVIDAGAAEGNFALSVVERASMVYIFETEPAWIEALEVTFAPWKEKVVIVNKYVSDKTNNTCTSLDDYFRNRQIDFIKADIEGAEIQLIEGAKNILAQGNPKLALCTYHNHDDAEDIYLALTKANYCVEFSKGYMIFLWTLEGWKKLRSPYLRRVLIRAKK